MYIGIDGGGTKTLAYLGDEDGKIIDTVKSGPSNWHSVGLEGVKRTFDEIIYTFLTRHKLSLGDIRSICIGTAGVDCEEDREVIYSAFRQVGYGNKLKVFNDSVTSLVGANGKKEGAIIISGTGSIAYGIDDQGKSHRVGGWGHIIDDVGSGYYIGREALKSVMESYDGRKQSTLLWDVIKRETNVKTQEELIPYIYSQETKKQDIAKFAEEVLKLYNIDTVATQIVNDSARELSKMVTALSKKIRKDKFSLAVSGSVIEKSDVYREKFIKEVSKRHENIDVHLPYEDAAKGALIMAIEE